MGTLIFIGGAESAPPPPVEVLQYPRLFRVKFKRGKGEIGKMHKKGQKTNNCIQNDYFTMGFEIGLCSKSVLAILPLRPPQPI